MSSLLNYYQIGAGPAGLVTALTLAQSGVPVRIVDKDDAYHTGSRGFGVQPRTYELFETLGILEDVKKHATPIPPFRAYKPGTLDPVKEWTLYPPRQSWPDRPNSNGECLRQEKLEAIMRDHLAKYGISVEMSKGLVNVEQDKDGVTATLAVFKNGQSTAVQETVICQYLVGADGAKGVTRKLLGLTFQGETRDADGQVWGDVEIDGLGTEFYWHVWGDPGKWSIIARPLVPGGNRFGVGITCQTFDPVDLATPEKAEEFIRTETKLPRLRFGRWEWISYFKPNMRMVNKFHEGRVWIIGDVAHVHSPTGGQGMNNSVQDACNIGWKLSLVLKGLARSSLLNTLDEERLPVITQMLAATSQLYTHMVSHLKPKEDPSSRPPERSDDDKQSGWYRWRNDALELYGVNYRYSSIVLEERDRTPLDMEDALAHAYAGYEGILTLRAGDRAPDAPGLRMEDGTTTTLFKLLSPARHTILAFVRHGDGSNFAPVVGIASRYPKDVCQTFVVARKETTVPKLTGVHVLVDSDDYVHKDYAVKQDAADIIAIRPDGVVMTARCQAPFRVLYTRHDHPSANAAATTLIRLLDSWMATAMSVGPSSSQRPDPKSLTTLPEILSSLSVLESEEAELSTSLSELLSDREPIVNSLTRIQSLVPRLNELYGEATLLSGTVTATAKTADRVGGRVRLLDEEMRRVREAGERVGQVMELKSSLAALGSAMEAQDWESATRHCARAMALPLDVTSGPFAELAVPTAEDPLPPAQALQAAREELLSIFREQFEQASTSRDAAATSRFFKLFPAIGWEAEGLEVYASFVVDLVKIRPPASAKTSSPLYYITALTALFESIAMIVDQHQPVVEKYYGPGKMTKVLERLLEESDRVTKSLVTGWEEERTMKRKLSETSNASFQTLSTSSSVRRTGGIEEDTVDAREVDKVLSEVAGMAGRWSLFRKFLYERLKDEPETDDDGEDAKTTDQEEPIAIIPATPQKPSKTNGSSDTPYATGGGIAEVMEAIEASASRQLFERILDTYYVPLELWYTRTIIDKAHQLSKPDLTQFPATTTTPDDAFYILKVVLSRLLSTGHVKTVQRTSELLRDVMDRDYAGVIKKKLDEVYRTGGSGSAPRSEKESRQAFIILLNDMDISSLHMERLIRDLCNSTAVAQNFLDSEGESVKTSISSFSNLVPRFRSTLRAGIEQLFNQLLRPKLRMFIPDVYKDVSYVLDDDSYAAAEYNDIVRKRFVKAWEGLVEGYKDVFTESNFRLFFGLALDVLVRPWEKFVMALKYSELGAVRFDRDLRAVTTYLSSQTAFGDVREKFLRLQQISTLLNLDSEEDVDEFYNGSGIAWKLNEAEARLVASLRV
ncbi:hypothetical protein NM688_g1138 [Phlebia brevispora]|uniref:Uncharacterized protein n=1 Tax=Phlebia brevispora TaxID=194682 RepID=A0ACC1TCL6_9APHY|nr:hypothetical protein NM688_g1138 [Phlebia brevispora]